MIYSDDLKVAAEIHVSNIYRVLVDYFISMVIVHVDVITSNICFY